MNALSKQTCIDWLFGGLIFLLCVVLTVLQYRWTGQVADAEVRLRRAGLNGHAEEAARAFDVELNRSIEQLLPGSSAVDKKDPESVQLARFNSWKATHPRPIFSRLAMAQASGDNIELSLLDQTAGKFVLTNWPTEWSALRENLSDKITSGSPPFDDPRGLLLEFPVPGATPDQDRSQWLIVELDTNYLQKVWLPDLAGRYLDASNRTAPQIIVRAARKPPILFYASRTNWTKAGASVVSVSFNFIGKTRPNSGGPPLTGGHWLLDAWRPPGALEALVFSVRLRNLAVAGLINLMMLAAGIALIRHTRSCWQVAHQQMKFVTNVSHEFRTPLTVIRGAAHNIERGVVSEPEQVRKYSSLIVENCEQLTEMIEEVLAHAGAQKGGAAALRRPVMLPEVLNDAIAATAHDVTTARCEMHAEIPPGLPAVAGDAAALRRVFQNLITNAAKHGGQGGRINIVAAANHEGPKPTVEVKVADHGPGIPEEELLEIFKPFFRGAKAAHIRGSGLGLSLVREIVEAHKGSISVRSENGHGAIFTVRLPAMAGHLP
jgi:signal transduction histidine kinase